MHAYTIEECAPRYHSLPSSMQLQGLSSITDPYLISHLGVAYLTSTLAIQ